MAAQEHRLGGMIPYLHTKGAVKKVSLVILKSEAMKDLRTKKTENFSVFQTFVQRFFA